MNCPCGRNKNYEACCAKAHLNLNEAITAEDLMRSRYAAFVLLKGDYLMESHHPSTRPTEEKEAIINWSKSVKWKKLKVIRTNKGTASDQEGFVEFKAYYKQGIFAQHIHEHSKFVKEDGCWYYLGEA